MHRSELSPPGKVRSRFKRRRSVIAGLVVVSSCSPSSASTSEPAAAESATVTSEADRLGQPPGTATPSMMFPDASEWPVDSEWSAAFDDAVNEPDKLAVRLNTEMNRRLVACMNARGFDLQPIPVSDMAPYASSVWNNPLNEAVAAEFGYHEPVLPAETDPNQYSPEAEAALDGGDMAPTDTFPAGQEPCSASTSVVSAVYAPYVESYNALTSSLQEAIHAYDGSPQYNDDLRAWQDCMAESGYSFDSQEAARSAFFMQPTVTAQEVATRAADIECDRRVGLTQHRSEAQRSIFERWMAEHEAAITEVSEISRRVSEQLSELEAEQL